MYILRIMRNKNSKYKILGIKALRSGTKKNSAIIGYLTKTFKSSQARTYFRHTLREECDHNLDGNGF